MMRATSMILSPERLFHAWDLEFRSFAPVYFHGNGSNLITFLDILLSVDYECMAS